MRRTTAALALTALGSLVPLAGCNSSKPSAEGARATPNDASTPSADGMDAVERAKRFPWPEGMNGFKTGMTQAEFDAECAGARLDVHADGSRICLRPPAVERHTKMISAHFCGNAVCELLVQDMRAGETDAEWLAAFESARAKYIALYGPPRVEESSPPGCEGERIVACAGEKRAVRRYSWSFLGRGKEFGLVVLALQPIGLGLTFRNTAWLVREHELDKADPSRP